MITNIFQRKASLLIVKTCSFRTLFLLSSCCFGPPRLTQKGMRRTLSVIQQWRRAFRLPWPFPLVWAMACDPFLMQRSSARVLCQHRRLRLDLRELGASSCHFWPLRAQSPCRLASCEWTRCVLSLSLSALSAPKLNSYSLVCIHATIREAPQTSRPHHQFVTTPPPQSERGPTSLPPLSSSVFDSIITRPAP